MYIETTLTQTQPQAPAARLTPVVEWLRAQQQHAQTALSAWQELMASDAINALRTQGTVHDAAWMIKLTRLCLHSVAQNDAQSDAETLTMLVTEMGIWQQDGLRTVLARSGRHDDYYAMATAQARVASHLIERLKRY